VLFAVGVVDGRQLDSDAGFGGGVGFSRLATALEAELAGGLDGGLKPGLPELSAFNGTGGGARFD
jgi:hypothetical protein